MPKKSVKEFKYISLRIEKELHDNIKELADKEDRSVVSMINVILKKGVQDGKNIRKL